MDIQNEKIIVHNLIAREELTKLFL